MELWIRSQDKMNLVKVRQISVNYQDNKQIIANYMPELYENSGEYYEILGTYKTKERAIEVLNEIQNILKPKMIVNTYKVEQAKLCDGTQFIQPMLDDIQVQNATTYVYEMPKD